MVECMDIIETVLCRISLVQKPFDPKTEILKI
jgi:hypothetical protein